jgi:hypothetical protein
MERAVARAGLILLLFLISAQTTALGLLALQLSELREEVAGLSEVATRIADDTATIADTGCDFQTAEGGVGNLPLEEPVTCLEKLAQNTRELSEATRAGTVLSWCAEDLAEVRWWRALQGGTLTGPTGVDAVCKSAVQTLFGREQ